MIHRKKSMVTPYSKDILAIVAPCTTENSLMPFPTQESKKLTSTIRLAKNVTMSTKVVKIKLEQLNQWAHHRDP